MYQHRFLKAYEELCTNAYIQEGIRTIHLPVQDLFLSLYLSLYIHAGLDSRLLEQISLTTPPTLPRVLFFTYSREVFSLRTTRGERC